jgi:hypothetical protein
MPCITKVAHACACMHGGDRATLHDTVALPCDSFAMAHRHNPHTRAAPAPKGTAPAGSLSFMHGRSLLCAVPGVLPARPAAALLDNGRPALLLPHLNPACLRPREFDYQQQHLVLRRQQQQLWLPPQAAQLSPVLEPSLSC